MDLLPPANETNNDGPIWVAFQAGNQKLWLRLFEIGDAFSTSQEIRSFREIPRALSFVE